MTAHIKRSIYYFRQKWRRGDGMLVLTRKLGEAIQIGDDIEIIVVSVKGDQVKLGINAPKNVEIFRKEIYLEIKRENESASKGIADLLSILPKGEK